MLLKQIGVSHPIKKFILSIVHESNASMRTNVFVADTMCVHCRYYGKAFNPSTLEARTGRSV